MVERLFENCFVFVIEFCLLGFCFLALFTLKSLRHHVFYQWNEKYFSFLFNQPEEGVTTNCRSSMVFWSFVMDMFI